jgi:hypothetical protein
VIQSNYKFASSSGAPELSGRTFGNLEIDSSSGGLNGIIGEGNLIFQDITVTNGTMSLNSTGSIDLKGNMSIATGSSLAFNPSSPLNITMSGSEVQQIKGTGSLIFGTNTTLIINNSLGVTLNKQTDIPNLIITLGNFTINY